MLRVNFSLPQHQLAENQFHCQYFRISNETNDSVILPMTDQQRIISQLRSYCICSFLASFSSLFCFMA